MNNETVNTPITLTADEISAALNGCKTQLRIPMEVKDWNPNDYSECMVEVGQNGQMIAVFQNEDEQLSIESPFGKVGDVLWVKERHRPKAWSFDDGEVLIEYPDGDSRWQYTLTEEELETNPNDDYMIAICDELIDRKVPMKKDNDELFDLDNLDNLPHWRNADVMPMFASRIKFKITGMAVEKLNYLNLKDDEIKAEGADYFTNSPINNEPRITFYQHLFAGHWDKKHPYFKSGTNIWVFNLQIEKI